MAGKKKASNAKRQARFKAHPQKCLANKERRWKKQMAKWKKCCEKKGIPFRPKFSSIEEDRKASQI
jgi:hypothetical protein